MTTTTLMDATRDGIRTVVTRHVAPADLLRYGDMVTDLGYAYRGSRERNDGPWTVTSTSRSDHGGTGTGRGRRLVVQVKGHGPWGALVLDPDACVTFERETKSLAYPVEIGARARRAGTTQAEAERVAWASHRTWHKRSHAPVRVVVEYCGTRERSAYPEFTVDYADGTRMWVTNPGGFAHTGIVRCGRDRCHEPATVHDPERLCAGHALEREPDGEPGHVDVTVSLRILTAPDRPARDPQTFARQVVAGLVDNISREWFDLDDGTGYALDGDSVHVVDVTSGDDDEACPDDPDGLHHVGCGCDHVNPDDEDQGDDAHTAVCDRDTADCDDEVYAMPDGSTLCRVHGGEPDDDRLPRRVQVRQVTGFRRVVARFTAAWEGVEVWELMAAAADEHPGAEVRGWARDLASRRLLPTVCYPLPRGHGDRPVYRVDADDDAAGVHIADVTATADGWTAHVGV